MSSFKSHLVCLSFLRWILRLVTLFLGLFPVCGLSVNGHWMSNPWGTGFSPCKGGDLILLTTHWVVWGPSEIWSGAALRKPSRSSHARGIILITCNQMAFIPPISRCTDRCTKTLVLKAKDYLFGKFFASSVHYLPLLTTQWIWSQDRDREHLVPEHQDPCSPPPWVAVWLRVSISSLGYNFFTDTVGMILFAWMWVFSAVPSTNISFISEGDITIYC